MKTFMEHNQKDQWAPLENFKLNKNPCEGCQGKCCKGMYIDQGFVTDESKDHIRWAESHEGINIYLSEDNRWGIKIEGTKCKHLCDDGRCGIQDNKPKGCTEYYGMNPDGPFVECNLIKELIKNGHIAYKKEWISKLWPDQIPENLKLD